MASSTLNPYLPGRLPRPSSFLAPLLLLSFAIDALAQPATLTFSDCFSGNASQKMEVSTVYGQILTDDSTGRYLNLTLLGQSQQDIVGLSNDTGTHLTTLFTTTSVLTFQVWTNSSELCQNIRPPSPLPNISGANATSYCPIAAGPFGLSTTIPWNSDHQLTTLVTRVRAVDPYSNDILCADISTTPLHPGPVQSVYGQAGIIFWASVSLAIAFWLVVGIARIVSAWGRGATRGTGLWSKVEGVGYTLASAISGERLATSPALMRFCTPSMRDIIFHTQWCSALAMVAVEWPTFVYPLLAQTAWASLSYNITVSHGLGPEDHWNPLSVAPYNPPSNFAGQLNDSNSPLYLNPNVPNVLFNLPINASDGIESFAYTVGLRPQDLFGVCLALFLAIIAATAVFSLTIWAIDWLAALLMRASGKFTGGQSRSPRYSAGSKDMLDGVGTGQQSPEESRSLNGHFMFRATSRPLASSRKKWWKILRPNIGSFHGNVLHGNLVRILVLFHFPVTIFSCYQMALGRSQASLASVVLAAFSFAIISVITPLAIVIRLSTTSTNKLYDETRTLLFLGPLYNHYRHGSQLFASLLFVTNLAFGITIGCGQKSGTAQAIIILVIEVVSALVTSIWLPWGSGAGMGLISFLFCVARIVIAVLLVILTPTISIGVGAGAWVTYGILIILALVYLAFLLMLIVKVIEALVRIIGGVGFDRSRHVVDSGLLGACGLLGCCGGPRKRRGKRRPQRNAEHKRDPGSETSSYLGGKIRTPGAAPSTHSGPPPSVLRPEHALRPYREDGDDESGFIMGAWQPFPRPGYNVVSDEPPQSPAPQTSGFSRVGGGRAHYDSPYAIAPGSAQTTKNDERRAHNNMAALGPVFDEDDSPPPTASVANVARHAHSDLPPGAMAPHTRTKSQTAIIEHAAFPSGGNSGIQRIQAATTDDGLLAPSVPFADDDDDSEPSTPKKKPWYQLRRNRRASEGDTLTRMGDEEQAKSSAPAEGGRSFVVLRDRRQTGSSPSPSARPPPPSSEEPSSPTRERPQSFVVIRNNKK